MTIGASDAVALGKILVMSCQMIGFTEEFFALLHAVHSMIIRPRSHVQRYYYSRFGQLYAFSAWSRHFLESLNQRRQM